MNMIRRIVPIGVAAALSLGSVCPVHAASTEFSRSAEEWARLQDNVLEYGEIADLVHEYNATVNKNQIELNDFRKKYGVTNDEWANKYRELADELDSAVSEPDAEDSSYVTAKMRIISNEMQAKQLRDKADDALEDYQVKYYDCQAAEIGIVAAAQTKMIDYYLKQLASQKDANQLELLKETYRSTVVKQSLGNATATEVLLAEENVKKQEKLLQDDQSGIETAKQTLLVLLGWKHDDQPEILGIPDVDLQRVDAMNPDVDKALAVENSYVMKSQKKQLENVGTQNKKEDLERTIREKTEAIGTAVAAAYMDVLAKKAAYEMNVTQAALEDKKLGMADRQYQLGSVSRMEYITQQKTTDNARIQVETARLNLIQAVQTYENLLNGSAG